MIDPLTFWEEHLQEHWGSLQAVGYSKRSRLLNQFLYRSKVRAVERALSRVPLDLKASKILDVGTGTGFWVNYFLKKEVSQIVAIDFASTAIEKLSKDSSGTQNVTFLCADIASEDFKQCTRNDGFFDLVIAMDVLYHIVEDKKFSIAIRNIASSLKTGGVVILSDFLSSSKDDLPPNQLVHFRGLERYQQELKRGGLEISSVIPMYFFLNSPIDAGALVGKILNLIYYKLTFRLTMKDSKLSKVAYPYLTVLYNIDTLLTKYLRFGVSTKLLISQKKA